ncbi:leucine rich repeat domain containing protein [Acanthamoeba castellanii str. Neff]|uniref:Leucine rich repeat domain containing protein n=1 Tax=Acanthamoeba castellanii (strain ATCC 30010 / Neff) TaxID=1257118 RepID=L8GVW2_ACACF|nr:leucine rich repeat domain containing protein [Acanthamoeba castellanii str. Neff]ELR17374.1 leucine rich repeat domain containing protein [Acanthamoeba castellanii str. Neff]
MNQPPALLDLCIEFVGLNITTLPSAHVPVELKERMLSFLNRRSMLTEARLRLLLDPDLRTLDMSGCRETNNTTIVRVVKCCPNITSINLAHCPAITDFTILEVAKSCKYLTSVNLCHCTVVSDTSVLQIMRNCRLLRKLDLSHCAITGYSFVALKTEQKQQLRQKPAADAGADATLASAGLPHLHFLNLSGCSKLNQRALFALMKMAPRLEALFINNDFPLQLNDALRKLAKPHHQNLKVLSLRMDQQTHIVPRFDGSLDNFVRSPTAANLKCIDLAGCMFADDRQFKSFIVACPNISRLILSHCASMSEDRFIQIAKGLPHLEMLSLANCGSIQDKCVEQLCANMASTSLSLLNLSRCKGLTDKSVEYLMQAKSLANLQKLIISGCSLSSPMFEGHPSLAYLDVSCHARFLNPHFELPALQQLNMSNVYILHGPHIACPLLASLHLINCERLIDPHINCPALNLLNIAKIKGITKGRSGSGGTGGEMTLGSVVGSFGGGSGGSAALDATHASATGLLGILGETARRRRELGRERSESEENVFYFDYNFLEEVFNFDSWNPAAGGPTVGIPTGAAASLASLGVSSSSGSAGGNLLSLKESSIECPSLSTLILSNYNFEAALGTSSPSSSFSSSSLSSFSSSSSSSSSSSPPLLLSPALLLSPSQSFVGDLRRLFGGISANLKSINLKGTKGIPLEIIAEHCPGLLSLNLSSFTPATPGQVLSTSASTTFPSLFPFQTPVLTPSPSASAATSPSLTSAPSSLSTTTTTVDGTGDRRTKSNSFVSPMSLSISSLEDFIASHSLIEIVKTNFLAPPGDSTSTAATINTNKNKIALENLILRNLTLDDAASFLPASSGSATSAGGVGKKNSLGSSGAKHQQRQSNNGSSGREQRGGVVEIASPSLKTLDLSFAQSVTEVVVNCSRLQNMNLSSSKRLERVEMRSAHHLFTLNLKSCPGVKSVVISSRAASINLRTLNLGFCIDLTEVVFRRRRRRRRLQLNRLNRLRLQAEDGANGVDDVAGRLEALRLHRVDNGDSSKGARNGVDSSDSSGGGAHGTGGGEAERAEGWKRERRRELTNVTLTVDDGNSVGGDNKGKDKESRAVNTASDDDEHSRRQRDLGSCGDDVDEDGDDDEDEEVDEEHGTGNDGKEESLELGQLRVVDLSRCAKMSFDNIYDIVRHSRETIQELYLTGCDFLDNIHVIRILRKAHCLQVLDLNECSKVNNEVFLWLIDAKEQGADVTLQRMTVVWNKGMTEEVRRRLRQELPTLLLQIHYRTTWTSSLMGK